MAAHVGEVARVVAGALGLRIGGQRHLVGVWVLPVEERVVEARAEAARAHGVCELARDIAACGRDVRAARDVV